MRTAYEQRANSVRTTSANSPANYATRPSDSLKEEARARASKNKNKESRQQQQTRSKKGHLENSLPCKSSPLQPAAHAAAPPHLWYPPAPRSTAHRASLSLLVHGRSRHSPSRCHGDRLSLSAIFVRRPCCALEQLLYCRRRLAGRRPEALAAVLLIGEVSSPSYGSHFAEFRACARASSSRSQARRPPHELSRAEPAAARTCAAQRASPEYLPSDSPRTFLEPFVPRQAATRRTAIRSLA